MLYIINHRITENLSTAHIIWRGFKKEDPAGGNNSQSKDREMTWLGVHLTKMA